MNTFSTTDKTNDQQLKSLRDKGAVSILPGLGPFDHQVQNVERDFALSTART